MAPSLTPDQRAALTALLRRMESHADRRGALMPARELPTVEDAYRRLTQPGRVAPLPPPPIPRRREEPPATVDEAIERAESESNN